MSIGCGHFLGDTCCVLPWKHEGDHQPADTVVVDRRLQPINRRYVVKLKGVGPVNARADKRKLDFANVYQADGDNEVFLGPNFADEDRGTAVRRVNRPAVRVGDRWVRRCPDLEVVEPVA